MRTATKCHAKDPSTCRFHGTAVLSVDTLLNDYLKFNGSKAAVAKTSSEIAAAALESPLKWEGKTPKWWNDYKNRCESDEALPNTPELLDVIDSPLGKLAVVFQPESLEDQDRNSTLNSGMGEHVTYYLSEKTGEKVGYVKMAYMNAETLKRSFGDDEFTPLRWATRYEGFNHGFDRSDDGGTEIRDYSEEEKIQLRRNAWLQAVRYNRIRANAEDSEGRRIAYYNISAEHIPDDETVNKDLKAYSDNIRSQMKDSLKYYETPYVDFSRVQDELKGKGFGTALYLYTGRRLAQDGKVLRGSNLQSDEAEGVWARFQKKFPKQYSTIELSYRGEASVAPILNFQTAA